MKVLFCNKALAFYPEQIYPGAVEGGSLVALSEEEKKEFWRSSPPAGYRLGVESGRPSWVKDPGRKEDWARLRALAYRAESDPIRFEAEADAMISGIAPDFSKWIEKVLEIKSRYPKPNEE